MMIFCGAAVYPQTSEKNSPVIAFVSDTQEPMMIEKLWLKGDNNELASREIFRAINKEQNLSALFHLGDLTAMGFWPWEWNGVSSELSPLWKRGIPVYPAMGNHEYFLFSSLGRKQFFKHFPYIKSSWYAKQTGDIAVILLNSNFSELSEEEISRQQRWYEQKLREFDRDPSVHYIIVGTHHPPYTNSKVVGPSSEVQRMFVPAFLKTNKCKLFISGHAHAFEHFRKDNKDFMVIGGGGGLLHPTLTGMEARYRDLYTGSNRMFHYVTIGLQKDSMVVRVKMINRDFRSFGEVHRVGIGR
ncbi:MAG: metallophosphoesterase [Ignavibacteria bacterium]|nr:metallophosphoesterase [Ignavibacteria bacterium]